MTDSLLKIRQFRWAFGSGAVVFALGTVVLIGRFTNQLAWVTILPGGSPMAFPAAVGFLLGGAGLMAHAAGWVRLGLGLGLALAVLGGALLGYYTGKNHFGWFADWLKWTDAAPFGLRFRSPASLSTSACLLFFGVALALLGRPQPYVRTLLIGGAVMFSVPVLALLAYLTGVELYSYWWRDAGMAFPAAIGLMVAAVALVAWALKDLPREQRSTLRSLPLFVAVTAVVVITGVTAVVSNRERERVTAQMNNAAELIAALDLLLADCDRLQSERMNAQFNGGATPGLDQLVVKLDETLARVRQAVANTPPYLLQPGPPNRRPQLMKPEQERALASIDRMLRQEIATARAQAKVVADSNMIQLSLMPTIRSRLVEFVANERKGLLERQGMARDAAARTDRTIVLGNALAAALGLLAVLFVRRADQARDAAIAALRASEERFRTAFDYAGVPMGLANLDGRWVRANRALCDLLGYDEAALCQLTLQDLAHPDDVGPDGNFLTEVISGRQRSYQVEKRYAHRSGRTVWVRITVARVTSEKGEPVNLVVQIEDTTERRALIETLARARDVAEKASQHKSEFLANMSHEVRTPMNGVVGMADLLLDTPLDAGQREMARTIQQSAQNLTLIINDVLDFSKIEAGKFTLSPADFDFRATVESTLALLRPTAAEKRLALAHEFHAALNFPLHGDAGRLRQVLLNLVGNAVKFTDRGSVRVVTRMQDEGAAGVRVRVEVRDTGIGIGEESLASLFQPFTQVDGTSTRRFGGTGLGLAISRQLVELMGGKIGVASQLGEGSEFWFEVRLPHAQAAAEPAVAVATNLAPGGEAPPRAPGATLKFLVVEDNKVNQLVARRLIEKSGWIADVADNGAEALAQLAEARYDAVLMDCQMPEMDGYTATKIIRDGGQPGLDPRTLVIALTAFAMTGDREKCLAAGMNDYVTKPLRLAELHAALRRCGLLPAEPADKTAGSP